MNGRTVCHVWYLIGITSHRIRRFPSNLPWFHAALEAHRLCPHFYLFCQSFSSLRNRCLCKVPSAHYSLWSASPRFLDDVVFRLWTGDLDQEWRTAAWNDTKRGICVTHRVVELVILSMESYDEFDVASKGTLSKIIEPNYWIRHKTTFHFPGLVKILC